MKLDMLSDDELEGEEGNKKILTEKEKRDKFVRSLKQSCIKAKNVSLIDYKSV